MTRKHVSEVDRPGRVLRVRRRYAGSMVELAWTRGREMELMHRAMGFAALGFLTLVPLLIVIAATDPASGQGFARWMGQGIGVSAGPQHELEQLFGRPRQALQGTTALGLAALAVFGLSFGGAVQTGYERVWDLSAARWHTMWRHVVWLAGLIVYLVIFVNIPVTSDSLPWKVVGTLGDVVAAYLFVWWSQRVLLAGRVRWSALAPGAAATALGMLGLRVFSQLVFSPLIASSAVTYGPFGTVLVIQSWLVGVGFVVYGGALVGRLVHESRTRRRLREATAAAETGPPGSL
ncbi:YhjD/YihY/BrkB family envelope integrity protein [Streptomyces montanisoli]|uniref:YihY/virulence factor BrkB family protein n=1 Tax=Streptomyces montanisoli TaxID=2798581 RepID=A0A940MKH8_9ACTN|nr:YihY/virulence factor BrkB family protein [Streptomyces montanisoli]